MIRTRDEGGLGRGARAVAASCMAVAVLASGCGLLEGVGDFHVAGPTDAARLDAMDAQPAVDSAAGPEGSTTPESSASDVPPPDDAPPPDDTGADSMIPTDSAPTDSGNAATDTGSVVTDSGRDVTLVDGCVPSGPEICTDGIDNDCNGLVDCADPACAAYECVDVPATWSLVAFDPAARAACPAGYGPAQDVLVDPSLAPYTCSCGCTVAMQPSCTAGQVGLYSGVGCATLEGNLAASGGACIPHDFGYATHLLEPAPPTGGSCSSVPKKTPPPAGTAGETCPLSGPVGKGCQGSQQCVLEQVAPVQECVAQAGAGVACPAGFPASHAAGTGLTDTRGCGPCGACGAPMASCTNEVLSLYSDVACATLADTLPANGLCDSTPVMAESYIYSATVDAQCAAAAPAQPTGNASLAGAMTVCCP